MITSLMITDEIGPHLDEIIQWAVDNCASFTDYKLVELSPSEMQEHDCWFKLDIHFDDEVDSTLFLLRWL